MYNQGAQLNRRPNMKTFNQMQGGRDLEDDDEPITSSFTKSKVDDDDDKFKNRDNDFPDFIFPKKKDQLPTPPAQPIINKQTASEAQKRTPAKKDLQSEKTPDPTPQKPEPVPTPKKPDPTPKRPSEERKIATPIKEIQQPEKKVFIEKESGGGDQIFDINSLQRPQFVRKGKNSQQVQEIAVKLSEYNPKDDRIRVLEPRNLKVVSRSFINSNVFYFDQKQTFSDPIFPPNRSQLHQLPWKNPNDQQPQFSRANQLYSDRPVEAFSVIDPNDVTPGGFKTLNLMKALAALAEQPVTIARILENQKVSQNGFYYVRLFVNGVWQFIAIDDSLPQQRGGPAQDERVKKIARNSLGYATELWVSLIEKAFSKVYGSYEDIEVNPPTVREYLWQLTGAPVIQTDEWLPFAVVELKEDNMFNLPHQLGYTILGQEKNQIRLRNPWGWTGSTQNKVKQVGNEGEFTVSTSDLNQSIKSISASMFKEGYWSVSHSVRQMPRAYSAYTLSIQKDTHCFVSFIQVDERYFRNNLVSKYKYSFARLLIFDEQNDLVGSSSGEQQYLTTEMNLIQGRYTVIICIDWNRWVHDFDPPYDSTLHFYGSENCELKRFNLKKRVNIFSEVFANTIISSGEKHNVNSNTNKNVQEYFYLNEEHRLFGIAWQNNSQEEVTYRRDFREVKQKNLFTPITFLIQQPTLDEQVGKILESRDRSWLDSNSVEMKLSAEGGTFAVLFRQPDMKYSKETLKQAGLL